MPGLIAFRRRWRIGSDDFVFPGLAEIGVRFVWLSVICVVFEINRHHHRCKSEILLETYYIGMISLVAMNIAITVAITCISGKGAVMDLHRRRHLAKLLYLKFVACVPELGWNILGAYFAFGHSTNCDRHMVYLVRGTVIFGFIAGIAVIIGIAVIFDPLGKRIGPNLESSKLIPSQHQTKVWEDRCRLICCCAGSDPYSQEAFTDISQLLAEFFEDVDLVATDIAAGLVLLQLEQERKQLLQISPNPQLENTDSVPDWMNTKNLEHFMKYAMASYGWPLYMFMNLGSGLCKLWSGLRCCSCCCAKPHQHTDQFLADNCCTCNMAAIMKFTGAKEEDIIYANFQNQLYETPFYVALDHPCKSIVVSIRGTLSLKDALTDLTADGECVCVDGMVPEACIAHKGILQAAKYVHETLEHQQLLVKLTEEYPDYQLVITGHSLGAGTAAILAVLNKSRYPDLKCYAFSPPGGLLSLNVSKFSCDFVCSVVLGKDFIPRLSLKNIDTLKEQLLEQIENTSTPKFRILTNAFCRCMLGSQSRNIQHQENTSNSPLMQKKQAKYGDERDLTDDCKLDNVVLGMDCPKLYPPGRILHITTTDRELSTDYISSWKSPEEYDEILVSPDMIIDHLPDVVFKAIASLNNTQVSM